MNSKLKKKKSWINLHRGPPYCFISTSSLENFSERTKRLGWNLSFVHSSSSSWPSSCYSSSNSHLPSSDPTLVSLRHLTQLPQLAGWRPRTPGAFSGSIEIHPNNSFLSAYCFMVPFAINPSCTLNILVFALLLIIASSCVYVCC